MNFNILFFIVIQLIVNLNIIARRGILFINYSYPIIIKLFHGLLSEFDSRINQITL